MSEGGGGLDLCQAARDHPGLHKVRNGNTGQEGEYGKPYSRVRSPVSPLHQRTISKQRIHVLIDATHCVANSTGPSAHICLATFTFILWEITTPPCVPFCLVVVTRSPLRVLCWVVAFCRPLRPVLLLVSFPRLWSPVVGVLGLCWMWQYVPFVCQRRPAVGVLGCAGCCGGRLTVIAVRTPPSSGRPQPASGVFPCA